MRPLYEDRRADYSYRDDNGKRVTLRCNAHLHYHLELICMYGGSTQAFVDSGSYTLEAGDILLVFPNQIHRFEGGSEEEYKLFIINPDTMPEISRALTTSLPVSNVVRGGGLDPSLMRPLAAMAEMMKNGTSQPYQDVVLKGEMLTFFGTLLAGMELVTTKEDDSQSLKAVVRYCSQHFNEPLSLDILAQELHISKFYISHMFSHKLNMRFNDYINSLRVYDACRYLRQSDKSITEIAELTGFATLRTFNRAFAKQMGAAPSQYRREGGGAGGGASFPR